jgi:hypothetical protein
VPVGWTSRRQPAFTSRASASRARKREIPVLGSNPR